MKRTDIRRGLAAVLATLTLVQGTSLAALAAEADLTKVTEAAEEAVAFAAPQLQSGEAVIPEDASLEEVEQILFNTLVANKDQVEDESLEWEYYCTGKNGLLTNDAWGSVNGFTSEKKVVFVPTTFTHPALSANEDGNYQVRLAGTTAEVTLHKVAKLSSSITLNEGCTVGLPYNEDATVDFETLYQSIFNTVVESTDPVLTLSDVKIEYYATATTGSVGEQGKDWMPLEGGKGTVLGIPVTYPAISEGSQKIRVSYAGTDTIYGTSAEIDVTFTDREQVQFNLNPAPYEVGLVFDAEQGYDYDATAAAIYDAVVASITPASDGQVSVEYNVDKTSITDSFKPLNETDLTGLIKFGTGEWEIKISVGDTKVYKGNSTIVTVNMTDSRPASIVALKPGVSFTYNMDASVMEQAIFDNAIDWENSTLPAKETLSADDFEITYYSEAILFDGGIDSGIKSWVPLEGKSYDLGNVNLGTYPQMGAGEQSIHVSYKGDANFHPSENAEGTVTVNKAKVSVKVNSANIFAGDELPENFITTSPADQFDLYTIYAGVTSNVTTGLYLDLPERYTDNSLLIQTIDKALEAIGQKTLTQMMQEGITVGELRELLSTQELLDLLDKLNIDTGTFGQILTVINKLPGILDSVRISFGTPNRAGLYTVAVVTDNKNYETGVGMGFLLVKMRLSGTHLTWNREIPNGKLSAADAKSFDFKATLTCDGEAVEDQSSVHYLYSGMTSKWRIYSSTTTPPTEPGRYVVTVCILGGNYMAAPLTRSFQITK
ncbi:hypothetical protein INF37_00785 [Pseudoflavonifractor sp. DSM 107456]|uniref:MBG domain-containing protein n=1 Tax=Pseudoflavonifractor gallinarum TaxID=2779352 RepID=A0ABR9R776_9FIRM|nr:hypothetical protein [Pseudoflavonifractor gallinarum]MBE5054541.1 hypothetical protein [Pseudoflavonifractor gallinarum]